MWYKPLGHLISNEFKRWAAVNGLPELAVQELLQLGNSLILHIYSSISAETLCE